MKIVHTSDWHLGQNFMGKSRGEEHLAFLSWLREFIENQEIEILIVSGDIFDTGTPANYALEAYYNFLKELSNIKSLLTTIITAGNHDSISTLKAPKELLKALNVHVITTGEDEESNPIEVYKDNKLATIICAVPFLRDSVIRSANSAETSSDKEKALNSGIKNYYKTIHEKAITLQKESKVPIIATGHLTTVGSRSSESERDIYIGGTLDIGGDYLSELFDYVALGHLHINQKVGGCERVRYSGSVIPLSFSEAKNRQKINFVDINSDTIEIKEIEIPLKRELKVIKGDGKSIKKELKGIENKECWIEVHIKDDNAMYVNNEIRELANKLELTILAVKIQRDEKQLFSQGDSVISLEELSVEDVFKKRLELEEIEDKSFEKELLESFKELVSKVDER